VFVSETDFSVICAKVVYQISQLLQLGAGGTWPGEKLRLLYRI